MEKRQLIKGQEGFTLIEIIAVLVILGILAAVAVPKFFDLQTKAREKAVQGAVAELTARVNQHFAQELLKGTTVNSITYDWALGSTNLDIGRDFTVKKWTVVTTNITWEIQYQSIQPPYDSTMSSNGFHPIRLPGKD